MRAPCKLVNGLVLLRVTGTNFLPISTESGVNVSTPADVPTTCCCTYHVSTGINTDESHCTYLHRSLSWDDWPCWRRVDALWLKQAASGDDFRVARSTNDSQQEGERRATEEHDYRRDSLQKVTRDTFGNDTFVLRSYV